MGQHGNKKKIRIGVLTDSMKLENWAIKMLESIQQSNYAEIGLIVLNDTPQPHKNIFQRALVNRHMILYRLFTRMDRKLFKQNPDAFTLLNAGALFAGIPILKVRPNQTQLSDRISDEDIDKMKRYDVDLFIRLGFRILRGKILSAARYGVWSYHHGDNFVNRGGPPGFWEVFENHTTTGSILQILTEDLDNGKILCRSWAATDPLSVHRNCNNYFWKSLSFFPRKLKELYEKGETDFFQRVDAENKDIHMYSDRLYLAPFNTSMIRVLLKHLAGYIVFKWRDLISFEQWILLFDIRREMSTSFWRFQKILPPKDRFWADPFVIYKEDTYYIFIEEYMYKPKKGHIAVIEMDSKGEYTGSKPVLQRPYHLSYPFIMEWEGDLYMIPETLENRTIEVYKCLEFPQRWEFHKTIMKDLSAADATLFYHRDKWWLFTMIRENEGGPFWDELFLFYADEPFSSDYQPHPMNPIRSDVRNSRPAGKIMHHNDTLYRIAQHSSREGYGYGLKINRIITLNESEYAEREIQALDPGWDKKIIGVHTFNHDNQLTLIDGKRRRSKFF